LKFVSLLLFCRLQLWSSTPTCGRPPVGNGGYKSIPTGPCRNRGAGAHPTPQAGDAPSRRAAPPALPFPGSPSRVTTLAASSSGSSMPSCRGTRPGRAGDRLQDRARRLPGDRGRGRGRDERVGRHAQGIGQGLAVLGVGQRLAGQVDADAVVAPGDGVAIGAGVGAERRPGQVGLGHAALGPGGGALAGEPLQPQPLRRERSRGRRAQPMGCSRRGAASPVGRWWLWRASQPIPRRQRSRRRTREASTGVGSRRPRRLVDAVNLKPIFNSQPATFPV
jgi:hypothetical protein